MTFSVIIPARFASTRLPGKLLLDLAGKPILQHTIERAQASEASQIVVATDDKRIAELGESSGASVVMTSPNHATGTDRIQEAAVSLGLGGEEIVVNVQGDEPLIPVAAINQVARNLAQHQDAGIATLCEEITDAAEIADPNAVKVVRDEQGYALNFSRSPIPHDDASPDLRHIGIYAYRVDFLNRFVQWPQSKPELNERLEQLRALSHGIKVHAGISSEQIPPGIDTEKDLEAARKFLTKQGAAT
ncbi:MAG: 3-deoxy-manno-octulosonate cytidylyltransferase [Gammaproteobacteria bacterium]|nr:3-deoxy-manno-octulosonate cytidylyltransferase [Gammaproteobacteria bacterium]MYF00987.1 3-deoxy-manno-octulosonate cytidylyltransferase [Gammaproteobacteria bacterium]MYG95479.1 3-deoxy-manno-octulosonate cytidylyltransferase [Gammaproteobacteria bacterium]